MYKKQPNPPLVFAPFGGWDAPSARPSATRWASLLADLVEDIMEAASQPEYHAHANHFNVLRHPDSDVLSRC